MADAHEMKIKPGDTVYMAHAANRAGTMGGIPLEDIPHKYPDAEVTIDVVKITGEDPGNLEYDVIWTNRPRPWRRAGSRGGTAKVFTNYFNEGEKEVTAQLNRLGIGIRASISKTGETTYEEVRFPPGSRR